MNKKLLQINATANWGSTGKIAEQIGQMAMKLGWESYIAYGRMMNPSKSKLIKIGNQWDVYLHYVLGRFFDMEGLASRRATRKLVREIECIKPDVIHLHNIHDHYLNYPILFEYLAKADIPVVWTQHDQWATTGHCAYNLVGCRRWENQCFSCPLKRKWSLEKSHRNYDLKKHYFSVVKRMTIVSVSDWLNSQIEKSFLGILPHKVIKNGVDTNVFKPVTVDVRERYGIGDDRIILGVASVWSSGKGLDDYIKLSENLPKGWRIVLVGEIKEDNVSKKIIHIHRTQNQIELAELYSTANVILSMSHSETFGLTIAESMACGTPVIVYNNSAQPELVNDETGCVVEEGDIEGILEHLDMFKNKSPEVSQKCRERAQMYYDKNKTYNRYLSLYNGLLGGGRFLLIGVANPWSERKGLKDYITLSKLVQENVLIVLVGLNEEQRRGLPKNIIGLGVTQNVSELVMLYSMADIVLNLSYAETFGLTTVEGFACGTPSIVYNATASPELVTPETGIVVAPGDISGLVKAVDQLLSKEKPINACRKHAIDTFNKEDKYQEYLSLYERLLD